MLLFVLFASTENRYCPLNKEEYLFDITTELANQKKEFYLLFQRTSWVAPLQLENNQLYIDVMFHQVRGRSRCHVGESRDTARNNSTLFTVDGWITALILTVHSLPRVSASRQSSIALDCELLRSQLMRLISFDISLIRSHP